VPHVIAGACANCGAELLGDFCHRCGQRRLGERPLSPRPFVHQFVVELLHFDFKSVRSLLALFRPGFLAAEFVDGRRITYLGPLKLYFLAAAIYFLIAPAIGVFSLRHDLSEDDGTLRAAIDARMAETGMRFEQFEERFNLRLNTVYTFSPMISAVAVALVLGLLYRREHWELGAHIVFALYYVAFFYFASLAAGGLYAAGGTRQPVLFAALLYAMLIPYGFFALKRVYGGGSPAVMRKTLLLLLLTFVLDVPVNIAARALTIRLT